MNIEFFPRCFQHISKDRDSENKRKQHNGNGGVKNHLPAHGVYYNAGQGRSDNRGRADGKPVPAHDRTPLLHGINRQEDNLGHGGENSAPAGLKNAPGHHNREIRRDDAQHKPRDKPADGGQVKPAGRKAGYEKGGQGHHNSHCQRKAAGQPLPCSNTDMKIFDNRRKRRCQCCGKHRGSDAAQQNIDKNKRSLFVRNLIFVCDLVFVRFLIRLCVCHFDPFCK